MTLKKICNHPGCNALIDISQQFCEKHSHSDRQALYDQSIRLTRDAKYHAFYLSPEWDAMKLFIKNRYKGLCIWNYYHGNIADFEEVHHVEPIKICWEKRLYVPNLIPLTHQVHMYVEAEYRKGNLSIKSELYALILRWNKEFGIRG